MCCGDQLNPHDPAAIAGVSYDGVTSALKVNANIHAPLLCVTDVFDIASGDLRLPGKVDEHIPTGRGRPASPSHRRRTMAETWLPDLTARTPQEGFDLAIKLARMAVKLTQPDETVREALRPRYANDASDLIAASHVVAVHFATIAAANDHWRKPS